MSKPYAVPSCYFPSTVFFIDDNKDFLQNFTLQLDERLVFKIFTSPYEALDAVYNSQQQPDYLNQLCLSRDNEHYKSWPTTSQTVNLDLAAIHWEAYNPKRFNEVSVVVVDYAMPGMNGLEFCETLEDSPVKKILLTGRADEKTAIEAFNKGIIDRYVRKNDQDVTQLINESIYTLQRQYFQTMSDMIIKMLALNSPSCLQDKKFAEFMKTLAHKHGFTEFYLTENSGSFLLLEPNGKPWCLIVKTKEDMQRYCQVAKDNNAPDEVVKQLKDGKVLPCFWNLGPENNETITDWTSCLRSVEKVEGNETYYYLLTDDPTPFDIDINKIYSYDAFLKEVDDRSSDALFTDKVS